MSKEPVNTPEANLKRSLRLELLLWGIAGIIAATTFLANFLKPDKPDMSAMATIVKEDKFFFDRLKASILGEIRNDEDLNNEIISSVLARIEKDESLKLALQRDDNEVVRIVDGHIDKLAIQKTIDTISSKLEVGSEFTDALSNSFIRNASESEHLSAVFKTKLSDIRIIANEQIDKSGIGRRVESLSESVSRLLSNSIVGFIGECPTGWKIVTEASGKYILGSTKDKEPGTSGGAASITLSASDVPGHRHNVGNAWGIVVPGAGGNVFLAPNSFAIPPNLARTAVYSESNDPSTSKKIDIQPQYYAVTWCSPA